ncbi:PTS glucose transporter subunit IIA [Aerococcaceae bacterium WGS1372]
MFDFFKKKDKKEEVKSVDIYAMCDGEFVSIEQVPDEVFAQKMMGDGFAILPTSGIMNSPVEGQVDNIFPTKHAISFTVGSLEILLHMGIDTVSLEGKPFTVHVNENTSVSPSTNIADVNLNELESNSKDKEMIIVFTNGSEVVESIDYKASGNVKQGDLVATVTLK